MIVVRIGKYVWESREPVHIELDSGELVSVCNLEDLDSDYIFQTSQDYIEWLSENKSFVPNETNE